jgi:predicted nucleotidyltransferase
VQAAHAFAYHARCGRPLVIALGSRVRNTAGPDSDLDLLVVMDTPLPATERFVLIGAAVQPLLGRVAVEPFVLTPTEYAWQKTRGHPFLLQILREGRVLLDDGRLDASVAA